jgi:hypothetical protein
VDKKTVWIGTNPWAPRLGAREAFIAHYAALRPLFEHTVDRLGLLLCVVDRESVHYARWLPALPHRSNGTIVGRHHQAGVLVPERFGEVSLRHLAVTCRALCSDELRLRVIDLNTEHGFLDEEGRELRSIAAEGSVFLRIGSVLLMAIVTGPLGPSGESAAHAYECIPDRVFLAEEQSGVRFRRPARASGGGRELRASLKDRTTLITLTQPPVVSDALLKDDDEDPIGRLTLAEGRLRHERLVGARALDRGVLLGRYERCQLQYADSDQISRVHLMLIRDESDILAIDTASTNGTHTTDGQAVRIRALRSGARLLLPGGATLGWEGC